MIKATRREAREQAFALIFEQSFRTEMSISEIAESAQEARTLEVDKFALHLASGVQENIAAIDEKIEKHAIGWKKNRISRVALAILRLALYEILFEDDIPVSVSINEAVEIAKKYGGDEDASFINGLLGNAASKKEDETCSASE